MAREKGPVWEHFNCESRNNNSHPHVQCKYCSKNYQRGIPERMQAHLDKKCPKAPNNAKSQALQQNIKSTSSDHINEEEQKYLEILLAKALSSAEVPSSFVENPLVIQFFQRLRPSFKLPSKEIITVQTDDNVKMVRRKGPVWEHFNSVNSGNDPHPHVHCKYCSKDFQRAVPERMQAHLDKKCPRAPNNAKSKFSQQNTSSIIDDFRDHISEEEQKSLEILLSKALYSAEVSSSFVDNPLVIQFFQRLRPSFKLPNRE
ncbi:4770_t:CDS:2 [Rhizophagus irregularis]|nr:4770_t:CDS:2 [Rhizophagus irregularis]